MFLKNSFKWLATFVLLISVFSVGAAHPVPATAAGPPDSSNVYWWWDEKEPVGSSIIVRTDSGISGNLNTSLSNEVASAKGLAVTLWIVVFNDPSECANHPDPCLDTDLFNPEVMADVLYGAGNVVGGSEQAALGYHRKAGDNSGSIADLFGMPTNNGEPFGLIDPRGAEVHYVVRSHGPKDPAYMPAQIDSFGGGCVYNYPLGYDPPASEGDLQLGKGDCQDIQFAINQP